MPCVCARRCRSPACPASPTATSRSRTPPRSAPRELLADAGARRPARACSTPAPPRAARRRICSSSPISTCWRIDRDAGAPGARRRDAGPPRPARRAPWPPTPPTCGLVGRPAVRRDPARRALQRLGHRAPPSRRALAAPRQRHRRARPRTQARLLDALWPLLTPGGRLALLHLLGVQGRGPGADRRFFATTKRRLHPGVTPFAGASAAAARQ